MSKIVQKWRKAMKGCSNNKTNKEVLIEHDFLEPSSPVQDFKFESKPNCNPTLSSTDNKIAIYNDYDNLQHQTLPKNIKSKLNLRDSNTTLVRGFRRVFTSKSLDKTSIMEDHNNLALDKENFSPNRLSNKRFSFNNNQGTNDLYYCEIPDSSNLFSLNDDIQPLIDLKTNENKLETSRISESKTNLFNSNKPEEQQTNNEQNQIAPSQSLNELRELTTFVSQNEAFHWYLNIIFETMNKCIKNDSSLNESDKSKRLNICMAHLLYSRNFYEIKISNCSNMKIQLANVHPCLIALSCFLDSDAVRIVESHSCACDSYVYLFSTRLKFCAWKAKLYIILKRPKRSSIDRLTLIEDLTNCHKIIQDKQEKS